MPGSEKPSKTLDRSPYTRLAVIVGLIVVLDQATKLLVLASMPLYASIPVIPNFFSLTHIHNPGGAFGFLAGQSSAVRTFLFLVVSFLAVILVCYLYRQTPRSHVWLSHAFALILGGAVGNLIDRVRIGKVVDFLDFYVGTLHWPAFNVADSAVTVGICILLGHLVLGRLPE